MFRMNSKLYDVLKIIALIVLPPLTPFILKLSETWGGLAYATEIATTVSLVATLLGAWLTASTYQYNKDKTDER